MKVACISNMNNNFFSLVRYLRDRGIDADLLLLDSEFDHFLPSADTFDSGYWDYTTTVNWGKIRHFLHFSDKLRARVSSDLEKYDFLIGCSSVPAYLQKIGRTLDIYIPHGGDLVSLPFFKPFKDESMSLASLPHRYRLHKFQRSGIQNARYIITDDQGQEQERALADIKIKGTRINYGIPMIYTPLYNQSTIAEHYSESLWYQAFKEIREKHDLVIFHHSRHVWKDPRTRHYKGNDTLLRGFAQFIGESRGSNPCIITCEYGSDVKASKELIQQLGIEDRVYWFPLLPRKEVMIGLSLCDIGAALFGINSLSCGTIYEILAMGKPLMNYREDSLTTHIYPHLYPMINIRSAEDVTTALTDYVARPEYYKRMGESGLEWFQKYAIDAPLKAITDIIRSHKGT